MAHSLSRPSRANGPNVLTGSKMLVHTVLKLMLLAITATYASSGASCGVGTVPTCRLLRGSLSAEATPAHISCFGLQHMSCSILVGNRQMSEVIAGRSVLDRLDEMLHEPTLVTSRECTEVIRWIQVCARRAQPAAGGPVLPTHYPSCRAHHDADAASGAPRSLRRR